MSEVSIRVRQVVEGDREIQRAGADLENLDRTAKKTTVNWRKLATGAAAATAACAAAHHHGLSLGQTAGLCLLGNRIW